MEKEIEENKTQSESEQVVKKPFWQRPKFPMYFGFGVGVVVVLSFGVVIATKLSRDFEDENSISTNEGEISIPTPEPTNTPQAKFRPDNLTKENLLIQKKTESGEYEILKYNLSSAKEGILFKGNFYVSNFKDNIESNVEISENGSFLFSKVIERKVNSQELFLWNQETEEVEKVVAVSEPTRIRNYIISPDGKRIAYLTEKVVARSKEEPYGTHWVGARLHIVDINGENEIEIDLLEAGILANTKTTGIQFQDPYVSLMVLETFLGQEKLVISRYINTAGLEGAQREILIVNTKERKIERTISDRVLLDCMESDSRQLLLVTRPDHGCCGEINASNNITEIIDVVEDEKVTLINEYERYDNDNENVNYSIEKGWFLENTDSLILAEWSGELNLILFNLNEKSFSAQERVRRKSEVSTVNRISNYLSPSLLLVNEDDNLFAYDFKEGEKKQIFKKASSLIGVY